MESADKYSGREGGWSQQVDIAGGRMMESAGRYSGREG
jgi:hypothetical protein